MLCSLFTHSNTHSPVYLSSNALLTVRLFHCVALCVSVKLSPENSITG